MKKRVLENCLYFTANSLARAITEQAAKHFKKLDMSPSHAFLLLVVIEHQEITLGELVEEVQLAHSTVSRHVDFHVARGLLSKRQEGKNVFVTPTQKGKDMKDDINACWEALYHDYSAVLGQDKGDKLTQRTLKAYDKIMASHD